MATDQRVRRTEFGGLLVRHGPSVIEPRPWTALQSRWAAELSPRAPDGAILELCAGAGHIGLLAARLSGRHLLQVDLNEEACRDAEANAVDAGLGERTEVRCAPLREAVTWGRRFPLVLADPPYIETEGVSRYPEDPVLAIDGGRDGLDLARECVEVMTGCLAPGGFGLLQLGSAEQADAMELFAAPDLTVLERRSAGPTRWVVLLAPTAR